MRKHEKKLQLAVAALFFAQFSPASAQDVSSEAMMSLGSRVGEISGIVDLPNPMMKVITVKDREGLAMISANGRFIMRGVIFDMWTGETLDSLADIEASRSSINLAKLGLKDEDVDPFYYGTGPLEVTMFVDPFCPFCQGVFDEINSRPDLLDQYRFKIFTVPFLGESSNVAVTILSCDEDRNAALKALVTHDDRYMHDRSRIGDDCDAQPAIQRTILSQMLGVNGVPFLVAPNGGISRGKPTDLTEFLANN